MERGALGRRHSMMLATSASIVSREAFVLLMSGGSQHAFVIHPRDQT
jgi:hypothetical protein